LIVKSRKVVERVFWLDGVFMEAGKMARIPEEELERLKREVSVARLVESRGIVLKKHGENLVGLCPFHADREPSLVVTPSKNLWHCLGACQAGGSVIDWMMRTEGVSFTAAVELLQRAHHPSFAASSEERRGRTTSAKLAEIASGDESDEELAVRVVAHYQSTLKGSGEGLAYLGKRRIESQEAIEHFKLGFANRTLGYRIPVAQVKAGAAIRGQLQRLGLYRVSGHEHFNGCLTVPIFDAEGRLAQMYGRRVREGDLRPGTAKHLYLQRPHTAVWNEAALRTSQEVILCESLIDALTFWCAGLTHVITSYGVEGFTKGHVAALKAHGVQKVLIAYDRDEAGDRAAEKLAPELAGLGVGVYRVQFPRGMDANEYAQKMKPVGKSLETAVRAAQWLAGTRVVQVPSEVVTAAAPAPVEPSDAAEQAMADALKADGEAVLERVECSESALPAAAASLEELPSLAALSAAPPVREESAAERRATSAAGTPASTRAPGAPANASPSVGPRPPNVPVPPSSPVLEVREHEAVLAIGPRTWRIRGLEKVTSVASIRVNVRVTHHGAFFTDSFDVSQHRARSSFLRQASEELGVEERVLKQDLGRVCEGLEAHVESSLRAKLEVKPARKEMSAEERAEALSLLKDPRLLERIVEDFGRCGVVGEETNKLVAYLATVSRKLESPLAVVIQSSSASGKSSLMDAVLQFVPAEEKVAYSAMTGQSLFYMSDLSHKVLAIAEEEGASKASYALKILQSSGELTIASTGKDERTGRLMTHEYQVQGPVMVMMTTTSVSVDEELLNRCLVLTVDEGAAQTKAIHEQQRQAETLIGMKAAAVRGRVMELHQNAQRLLSPLRVVNPYAQQLVFASHATRTRRDNKKYLGLIRTIALLCQHQREVKQDADVGRYIEVTKRDIEVANRLCGRVLARGLDELAPQTRGLLRVIEQLVQEKAGREHVERSDVRFTQRELRERSEVGSTQVKMHLRTLVDLEYVAVHRHGHAQRHVYELLASGEPSADPLAGGFGYDANRSGKASDRSATGRVEDRPVFLSDVAHLSEPVGAFANARPGPRVNGVSYPQRRGGAVLGVSASDAMAE
jgi:DNA primase catalytic core